MKVFIKYLKLAWDLLKPIFQLISLIITTALFWIGLIWVGTHHKEALEYYGGLTLLACLCIMALSLVVYFIAHCVVTLETFRKQEKVRKSFIKPDQ